MKFPTHPTEEILEDYALHRLAEPLAAQVEEHLLICPTCQDVVAETDRFVAALRSAASKPAPDPSPSIWGGFLTPARVSAVLVPVLAMLGFLAVRKHAQAPLEPVAVSILSLRGADLMSTAPAGRPLQLVIQMPDLGPGTENRVEVVDASGALVWKAGVAVKDGKLAATMPKPLASGVYWVRLYGPDSELVREFGLSAK